MSITISTELQDWLKKNRSKSIQAGVDSDFNRTSYTRTRITSADTIDDGDAGAANG